MPRIAKPLTAIEVGRLSGDGYYAVGTVAGLYLQVRGAARTWVLRIKIGDKRRDIGLGAYPSITLAMAFQKARERRADVEQGIDPIAQRRAAKSLCWRTNQRVSVLRWPPRLTLRPRKGSGAMTSMARNGQLPSKPMPIR